MALQLKSLGYEESSQASDISCYLEKLERGKPTKPKVDRSRMKVRAEIIEI